MGEDVGYGNGDWGSGIGCVECGMWRGKSVLQLAILSGRLGNFVAIGHYRNF